MFTGIVEELGVVRAVSRTENEAVFEIETSFTELVLGESIAINGVCLTAAALPPGAFVAHASAETLARTTLGDLRAQSRVHVERALTLGTRLGGHLVTGHVDGVGRVASRSPLGEALAITFEVPDALGPFLAPKGSVAVQGVSLTINAASDRRFDVVLVPFTQVATALGQLAVGAAVNIEVDILAKYVARLLGKDGVVAASGLTEAFLKDHGFA